MHTAKNLQKNKLLPPQRYITALAIASYRGNTSVVKSLLNTGAKTDVPDNVRSHDHCKHMACRSHLYVHNYQVSVLIVSRETCLPQVLVCFNSHTYISMNP